MPTYEYKCTKCGHRFEAIQSITADPLEHCPKCKAPVRRVINGGMGIIFYRQQAGIRPHGQHR